MNPEIPHEPIRENKAVQIENLAPFDEQYARTIQGEYKDKEVFIAREQDGFSNIRSFIAVGDTGQRLGFVQFFDSPEAKNIINTAIDINYRGQRLAQALILRTMQELGEKYFISFVNLTNTSSLRAMEKIDGIKTVSDAQSEKEYGKRKYRYDAPENV